MMREGSQGDPAFSRVASLSSIDQAGTMVPSDPSRSSTARSERPSAITRRFATCQALSLAALPGTGSAAICDEAYDSRDSSDNTAVGVKLSAATVLAS